MPPAKNPGLSKRECEVLNLLVQGFTSKQVANSLLISIKTLEKHRQSFHRKMGVFGIIALIRVALREKRVGLDVFFASREGEKMPEMAKLTAKPAEIVRCVPVQRLSTPYTNLNTP